MLKRKIITVLVLVLSLTGLVLGTVYLDAAKEDKSMNRAESNVLSDTKIPPIDVAAPAETETATFALG